MVSGHDPTSAKFDGFEPLKFPTALKTQAHRSLACSQQLTTPARPRPDTFGDHVHACQSLPDTSPDYELHDDS
jgi:hypothetical protein